MTVSDGCLASDFRDADASPELAKLISCLRFMQGLPHFAAYKARSLEMMDLGPGQVAADLGCGLGFDVPKLAVRVAPGGRAIGIDGSRHFLEAARRAFGGEAGVGFAQGDLHGLALADGCLDAVRVDRTLQHVAEPARVIAEMHRALKPGGRLVCAEPDWGTFVIDCHDPATADLVTGRWMKGIRNPRIGRQLLRLLRQEGLRDASLEGFILLVDGLEAVNIIFDVYKTVAMMEADDRGGEGRLAAWLEGLRARDSRVGVTASVTLFLARGRKAWGAGPC